MTENETGAAQVRALQTLRLIRELCREREAHPEGLEPAEAETLANALLRAFGQDEEYPCLLHDPVPRDNMVPAGGPAEPGLVATNDPAQAQPCDPAQRAVPPNGRDEDASVLRDPLLSLLHALVNAGIVAQALVHRSLGEGGTSPVRPDDEATGGVACATHRNSISTEEASHPGGRSRPHEVACAIPPMGGRAAPRLFPVIANLLVEAYLTPRQRQVARLMLWGWEPKEIASKLGIAASTVRKLWSRARKPLGEALIKMTLTRAREEEEGPISAAELREIYLEEVGRFSYHQPRHCAAGKERCKKTGVCEFALHTAHLVADAQRDE